MICNFNAATASRPWRTPPKTSGRLPSGSTSMRPRPLGRGEPFAPPLRRPGHRPLQCGHGLSAVENPLSRKTPAPRTPTSMRPRPLGRGEHRRHRHALRPGASTSMRPRPLGRGELPPAPAPRQGRRELQCGHGLSAVENGAPGRTGSCSSRNFNAATASRPWRTRKVGDLIIGQDLLQCGHGLSAVENHRLTCAVEDAGFTSMRPRPLGRGERGVDVVFPLAARHFNAATASRPWRTARLASVNAVSKANFNAATASRPWRTSRATAALRLRWSLQCGHGLSAVENQLDRAGLPGILETSMRPRPLGRGEPRAGPPARRGGGPDFNAATASRPWRTRRGSARTARRRSHFNAATASRPWRTARPDAK